MEHRRQTGYDSKLPGEGLLVYHIDDDVETNEDENHPKVKLLEADNQAHLHNGSNRGDDGDSYPGRSLNTTIDKASSPSSKAYSGSDTCISITRIKRTGASIRARVQVTCGTGGHRAAKRKGAKKTKRSGRKR